MSKKTVKRHYKKHRKSCKRTYRKHNKRHKRTYRKKGTGKGVQLFKKPKKMHSPHILVHQNDFQSGNMIPGLRKKM